MLPRLGIVAGLIGCGLVVGVAACQVFPVGGRAPGPAPAPTVPAAVAPIAPVANGPQSTTAGPGMTAPPATLVIWGKVPHCTCLDETGTANITVELKKARLAVDLTAHTPTGGWLYFATAFDPTLVSRDQVEAAIQAGGGQVVSGPP